MKFAGEVMSNQTPRMDEHVRPKYDQEPEEMAMSSSGRREEIADMRASLYQPAISTMPLNIPSQRDVVDFSFGRKDLMSTTASELKDLSKDDRLVLETFRALTAGNIGNVGTSYWPTRGPTNLEPTLPPFSAPKSVEFYSPAITINQQKDMLTTADSYVGNVSGLSLPEAYPRISKPEDRLYIPPAQTQPMESYPALLTPNHRSQDALGDSYRTVLSSYRLPTYPPSYETAQALNISNKSRSPSLDIPISKIEEMERSAIQAARDREQSNMDFENIHSNAPRLAYSSDTVSDLHVDKSIRHPLEMDLRASDFSTDRLRELAETVVYSQSLGPQVNYVDSMQKYDTSSYIINEAPSSSETTCVCIMELTQHAQLKKMKYSCGGCLSKFITICQLHEHLKMHGSGGSYHFDHVSNTAYPKYDTFCSYVQTDSSMDKFDDETATANNSQDTSDLSFSDTDLVELNKTDKTNANETEDALTVKSEVVNSDENTVINTCWSTEVSPIKGNQTSRKRKQDCPKSNKVRKLETEKVTRVTRRSAAKAIAEDTDKSANEAEKSTEGNDPDWKEDTSEDENIAAPEVQIVNSKTIMKPIKKRKALRRSNITNNEELDIKEEKKKMRIDDDNSESQKIAPALPKRKGRKQKNDADLVDTEVIEKSERKSMFSECHICKLKISKRLIRSHMLSHDAPYICEVCGKTFARPRFLKKHQVVHAEVKPWKCEMCGQQFCQKTEFKLHMNGHDGKCLVESLSTKVFIILPVVESLSPKVFIILPVVESLSPKVFIILSVKYWRVYRNHHVYLSCLYSCL